MAAPQVGELVENFTLPDQDGNTVNLTDFAGKTVVLFFYPKADTPGCTIEACEFRDNFPKFKKLQDSGVVILGISRDTPKAQKKFKDKFDLPYTLLADADQETLSAPIKSSCTSSPRSNPKATPKKSSRYSRSKVITSSVSTNSSEFISTSSDELPNVVSLLGTPRL